MAPPGSPIHFGANGSRAYAVGAPGADDAKQIASFRSKAAVFAEALSGESVAPSWRGVRTNRVAHGPRVGSMSFVAAPQPTAAVLGLATERLASFTVDVEQDCPPYLTSHRGMTDGMPALLDLLGALRVRATFFTTGEMARLFPKIAARIVADGHELACHGNWHRDFTRLSREEAEHEIRESTATLRQFGRVTSFRAPYLRFPAAYLDLLPQYGLRIDSSIARYKRGANHRANVTVAGLSRVPASLTSSALRLPRIVRNAWIRRLRPPRVLFVHPWEAADFRRSPLRWDCRFRTGEAALLAWRDTMLTLQCAGAHFLPVRELVAGAD